MQTASTAPKNTVIAFHSRSEGIGKTYVKTICRLDHAWVTTPDVNKARRFTEEGAEKAMADLNAAAPGLRFTAEQA